MKKTKTRTIEAFIDDLGILRVYILPDVNIDLEDAVDNFLVIKKLCGDKPRLRLIDSSNNWSITKEAKEYSKSENDPNKIIARAIIVKSFKDKIVSDILQMLYKPQLPQKCFLKEDEALNWLRHF